MHAASVDPEPGSNSPKVAQPCGCDFVRGFDRSHIHHFLDLCHSSVVKVQPTPKHAGVFGAERGVWRVWCGPSNGAGSRFAMSLKGVDRALRPQKMPVSSSRMTAAPASHDSSASWTEPGAAKGPVSTA